MLSRIRWDIFQIWYLAGTATKNSGDGTGVFLTSSHIRKKRTPATSMSQRIRKLYSNFVNYMVATVDTAQIWTHYCFNFLKHPHRTSPVEYLSLFAPNTWWDQKMEQTWALMSLTFCRHNSHHLSYHIFKIHLPWLYMIDTEFALLELTLCRSFSVAYCFPVHLKCVYQ